MTKGLREAHTELKQLLATRGIHEMPGRLLLVDADAINSSKKTPFVAEMDGNKVEHVKTVITLLKELEKPYIPEPGVPPRVAFYLDHEKFKRLVNEHNLKATLGTHGHD